MSNHANGKSKLNLRSDHRKALLRNQIISFINNGQLVSTTPRVREVKRLVEKLVTIAREGKNFAVIRRVWQKLPYDKSAVYKLIDDIAPRYVDRPGGYTRCVSLGRRVSDTAPIAILTWV